MKDKKATVLFLRHGKTRYTGQFPDLTPEGEKEIQLAADEIVKIVGGCTGIRMVSSTAPRALGSASIIAHAIGYPMANIKHEEAIRCMDFYDAEGAQKLWSMFGTARNVDRAYEEDARFEDGLVVEKRSAIQRRFMGYLGKLTEEFRNGELPEITINTCHYEVLWRLAMLIDPGEPLIHGEIIRVDMSLSGPAGNVVLDCSFRDKQQKFAIQTPTDAFAAQFDN